MLPDSIYYGVVLESCRSPLRNGIHFLERDGRLICVIAPSAEDAKWKARAAFIDRCSARPPDDLVVAFKLAVFIGCSSVRKTARNVVRLRPGLWPRL